MAIQQQSRRGFRNVRNLAATVALLVGLPALLTGCAAEQQFHTDSLAGAVLEGTYGINSFPYTVVPRDPDHVLEVPGSALSVNKTYLTEELPPEVGEHLTGADPNDQNANQNTDRLTVAPAEGEEFLVVQVLGTDPSILPADSIPGDFEARVLVGDEEITTAGPLTTFDLLDFQAQVWLLLSIPKDAQPADVVLEITDADRTQRLSLLDGQRIESDIEEYYSANFDVSAAEMWWEFRDEAAAGDAIISAGMVSDVHIQAAAPYLGWAEPGHAYLSVDLDLLSQVPEFAHTSTVTLTLPDGTVLSRIPETVPETETEDAAFNPFAYSEPPLLWFSVPLGLDLSPETATLNVHIAGTLGDAELDFGVTEIPLTFGS